MRVAFPLFALLLSACAAGADETLVERIMRHEGISATAYQDTLGNWTIGVGHLLPGPTDETWSLERSLNQLHTDLAQAEQAASLDVKDVWFYIPEPKKGVLTELAFILGGRGLAEFHDMLAAIHAGEWQKAADALVDSRLYHEEPKRIDELADILAHR